MKKIYLKIFYSNKFWHNQKSTKTCMNINQIFIIKISSINNENDQIYF